MDDGGAVVDGNNRPQAENVDSDVTLSAPGARGSTTPAGTAVLAESVLDRRYRLLSALTTRGPVTLWRGDDNVLARPVAVRIVEHDLLAAGEAGSPVLGVDPEQAARRLLAAAINSGRLVHPGAASTYDATTTTAGSRRISYVVSEWVDGRTMRQLTAQAALRPEQAGAVVLAAARVIAAAHERGIHHGDLNPGDVIVSSHGTVKIIDLEIGGVLAELERANGGGLDGPDDHATDPEATRIAGGGAVDDMAAADLRALGALLYSGLTGHWPLGGDRGLPTAPTSGGRLRTPRQVTPTVPRDLDAITMAALGDDRAGAPITTAAELVAELESVNPVDAVLDTGLMSLGESPDTGSMDAGDFDSTGYLSASDYPEQGRYADTASYPAPGRDDRYDTRVDRPSSPRGGDAGYGRGGFDTRGGYDDRGRDDRGYPPGPGGYPPADRYPSGPPGGRRGSGPTLGRALPWVALAVIVIVVAVVAVIALNGNSGGGGPGPTATSSAQATPGDTVLKAAGIDSFDPGSQDADKTEKPGEVNNAVDGNPSTVWHTEGYRSAKFGGYKTGVGLRLNFSQPISPASVTVQLGSGPASFELRSAASTADNIDGYAVVASKSDASGTVNLTMSSDVAPARSWVLWLTSLPLDPSDGQYRGSIAEITFRS
ncbi:protein kinase family protein [Frankia sp. AgB32]|uniref:protein kinase family protein n=1 Tax=Frankia sp. AgB32 TaxID=631119 RepID=UPI00200E7932|nr:protein kinase family protein [Frankia sp. AgB32]MCK9893288.1 protein kinase family protein [Frankia sp. AgB32]